MAGVNLRSKFRTGSLLEWLGLGLALAMLFGTIFLWAMFGASGLAGTVLLFNTSLFLAVFGIRNQIDSLHMALKGVNDTSDFTTRVRQGTDPAAELRGLAERLTSIQKELADLQSTINK